MTGNICTANWNGLSLRWGSASSGHGMHATPPVFVLADPDDNPLSRDISWMAIDAFEALVAAYPDGPSIENVRDMWAGLLRGVDRRIAEARLLEAEEMADGQEGSERRAPFMRIAGLIMTCVDTVPTWIAFSAGGMAIVGSDAEEIPMRDDVGWDMPGYLWTIPMNEGQRFAIVSDSLRTSITRGRLQSVLTNLVRAERAANALITSVDATDADAAALVVDVTDSNLFSSLSNESTMLMGNDDETSAGDVHTESSSELPGHWGLQLLGIDRPHDDETIRRTHSAPPEIDGFRFVSYLGSGGFSDVYLYEEELPRRMVAIKVLARRASNHTDATRFDNEVNIMAQLSDHPSIVSIYSASATIANQPYIAMQYCPLPSLSERISHRRICLEDALRMGVDIASALHTAHLLGIQHHDIKPSNVLYSSFGRPLLGDFGIATLSITSAQDVMGASIPWGPPEVLDGHLAGKRSDVFSLAATVFTAITGKPPYGNIRRAGESPHYEWLENAHLEPLFRDALETDPMLRIATAYDFAFRLREAQKACGFDMTPIEIPHE